MSIRCQVVRDAESPLLRFDRPTAIVIPAYNEAPHIGRLLSRCAGVKPRVVVVVDDASTDGTAAAAESAGPFGFELVILKNEHNLGKQGSVVRALEWLWQIDVDAVALIDG